MASDVQESGIRNQESVVRDQGSGISSLLTPDARLLTNGDAPSIPEPSVTSLVSGIIADAQQLIQQQLAMLRQEIRDDFRKTKEATLSLAVGAGVTLTGSALLLLTLPLLLHWAVPELPLWACVAIVGGVMAALGGVLLYAGLRKFKSFNPLPDQSVDAFKENLQWKTNQK